MNKHNFTKWAKWADRNTLEDIKYPGVYIVSITDERIEGQDFNWSPEIVYIGMTTSTQGLKGRLNQFDRTIIGKTGHGGADRVLYRHQNYNELTPKLYVAVCPFECNVKSNEPKDLRVMGEVTKFEYDCFAKFVEEFGSLPEFNNKKLTPKYSKAFGRNETASK